MHEFGQPATDGKSQSRTAIFSGRGTVGLYERTEQRGLHRRGDPNAGILDLKTYHHMVRVGCDWDDIQGHLALGREFHRVTQQVQDNLAEAQGIADKDFPVLTAGSTLKINSMPLREARCQTAGRSESAVVRQD